MTNRIVIVGGGLAGLAAAVYLARAGRTVTLFERRRQLGGRAVTHLRQGYRFNLGPHAVYRGGLSGAVLRELGVPVRGGVPNGRGVALIGSEQHRLPAGPFSAIATSLLSARGKLEAAKLALLLPSRSLRIDPTLTVREWLDQTISDEGLRTVVEAYIRVATYADDPDQQSAAAAVRQLVYASKGVVYVHEGWQKIVDSLHSHAVTAGVNFVTSSHVVHVDREGDRIKGIELGELELDDRMDTVSLALPDTIGETGGVGIPAETVLLAVDPATASRLSGLDLGQDLKPVLLSSLDVALSRLPHPQRTLAVGLDRPVYFSVHSQWAQLTPRGGALVHIAKYLRDGKPATEAELEPLLDELQPGWRDVLVHKRFLPSLTVSNALVSASSLRPPVRTSVRGLYVAGDWAGDEGMLADAALASARAAARAILADG